MTNDLDELTGLFGVVDELALYPLNESTTVLPSRRLSEEQRLIGTKLDHVEKINDLVNRAANLKLNRNLSLGIRAARLRQFGLADYSEYIHHRYWLGIRARYQASCLYKQCLVCGKNEYVLHHTTYENLMKENIYTLLPLCPTHQEELQSFLKRFNLPCELSLDALRVKHHMTYFDFNIRLKKFYQAVILGFLESEGWDAQIVGEKDRPYAEKRVIALRGSEKFSSYFTVVDGTIGGVPVLEFVNGGMKDARQGTKDKPKLKLVNSGKERKKGKWSAFFEGMEVEMHSDLAARLLDKKVKSHKLRNELKGCTKKHGKKLVREETLKVRETTGPPLRRRVTERKTVVT